MRKIAILGGTFNPIHNGHLHLIRRFSEQLGFDLVLLIPAKTPPHKAADHLAAAQHRLQMCRLAVQTVGYQVSDLEICRATPSYTVDTLLQLHQQYPGDALYFITGEDMFLSLLSWRQPQRMFQLATICSAPRSATGMVRMQQYEKQLQACGAHTVLQAIDFLPISSTIVREAVRQGKDFSQFVPASVADYITQHNLYKE